MDLKQSLGSHTVTIVRSAELASAVVVDWKIEGKLNSQDYEDLSGKINFAPGESHAVIIIPSPLSTRQDKTCDFDILLTPVTMPVLKGQMRCACHMTNDIVPAKIGFAVQTTDFNQSDKSIQLKEPVISK